MATADFSGLVQVWRCPFIGLTVVYAGGVHLLNVAEIFMLDPAVILCGSTLTKSIDDQDRMRKEALSWIDAVCETS